MRTWKFLAALLIAFIGCDIFAAQPAKPAAPQTKSTNQVQLTNAPVEIVIPKSVFIWNPKEQGYGRDPFFPLKPATPKQTSVATEPSTVKTNEVKTVPQPPPKPVIDLTLQGIVGNSLAVINNKNIKLGEEEMIPYKGGRIRVRCESISSDSVSVTIFFDDGSTEKRELSLKRR